MCAETDRIDLVRCEFQLRKPVSTVSIPGAMKSYSGARDAAIEEAGVALVGVHSEYPRFGEERALGGGTYKGGGTAKHKPNIGYRSVLAYLLIKF